MSKQFHGSNLHRSVASEHIKLDKHQRELAEVALEWVLEQPEQAAIWIVWLEKLSSDLEDRVEALTGEGK